MSLEPCSTFQLLNLPSPQPFNSFSLYTGAYAFIETSSPRRKGDVARFFSKTFRAAKARCMTFYYHMMAYTASHMGAFNVYIEKKNSPRQLLFSKNSTQGSEWIRESITLRSSKSYRVSDFPFLHSIAPGGYSLTFNTGGGGPCHYFLADP